MSAEWPLEELETIATEVTVGYVGPMATEYVESGIPFLRSMNIEPFQVNKRDLKFIKPDFHSRIRKSALQPNDVAIVRTGKPGTCAVIPEWLQEANCSDLVIVRCGERIRPRFLCYWVNSVASHHIESHTVGAVQQHFNVGAAKRMKVAVPSLSEQDQVIEVLGSIDDRITLLRETNATLEAMAQALFKSWFVDFDPVHANAGTRAATLPAELQALFPSTFIDTPQGPVPAGWTISRIGDITDRVTKGTTPTTLKKSFTETGINFVKVESLTDLGEFIAEKFAFIDEETHQLLKRSQLQVGDILVTIAGTIGRIAEVTEDIVPANTNQAVALIRPIPENLPSGLIRRFLQLKNAKQQMGERVVQAVQANLSLGSLSDMLVVVPPKDIVGQLYDFGLAAIDASKNNNLRQIRTLATLRDTLLPRLISGQLRLPDAKAALTEAGA